MKYRIGLKFKGTDIERTGSQAFSLDRVEKLCALMNANVPLVHHYPVPVVTQADFETWLENHPGYHPDDDRSDAFDAFCAEHELEDVSEYDLPQGKETQCK